MSGFTPTVKFQTDFDGDHLTFILKRLKVKHQAKIMSATSKNKLPEETTEQKIDSWRDLMDVGREILPECIVSMEGLTISGSGITDINIILEEAYFLPLVDLVLAELMRSSRVQDVDVKNLNGPQEDTLKE